MAVHDDAGKHPDAGANTTQTLGFGSTMGLISATRGSEYTNTIAKAMTDIYSKMAEQPHVLVLDNEDLTNLAYSAIVVSKLNANKEVCYHTVLLATTGSDPMRASDIVAEATRALQDPNANVLIYTPSDAINHILTDIIEAKLAEVHGSTAFISTDGVVVKSTDIDTVDLGMRVAAIAYNAVNTEALLSSGLVSDLNIAKAIGKTSPDMRLDCNLYNTVAQDIVGSAVRQDFKVDLVHQDSGNRHELNADTRRREVSVAGYVDAIREDLAGMQQPGMPPIMYTRLHPNIVLTNIETALPTVGFMLLGIATATVMARNEMWLQSLASIDPKSPNTPGALNQLTNIEGTEGPGVQLDFSSKEVTIEEHYASLNRMYTESAVISQDVEVFGPQSQYAAVISAAAAPNNSKARADARAEIIEAAYQLTNGNFPADYPEYEIFACEGLIIPMGHWTDKAGERDIRDVDLAFVCSQTSDMNLINKWSMTSLPRSITKLDPFLTRVEIINQLIPDAVISGKATHVTYTNKFLSTLTAAIEAAGLKARYESAMVINQQYSTSQFTDYLSAAGLSGGTGFAHQGGYGTQTGAYTPYAYMGQMGR